MTASSKGSAWAEYNKQVGAPRPRLIATLDQYCKVPGHALDLGCGSGRDTFELLKRGWHVTAVDADADSLDILREHSKSDAQLRVECSTFESLQLPANTYDLINASYALPFCKPALFASFWDTMIQSLKPEAMLTFELFGVNDDWAKLPNATTMCFHSRPQVEALLSGLSVEVLKESEFQGATFAGPEKHWHIFLCIVRKPSSEAGSQ